jgi:putative DNA primase/helicase
MFVSTNYRPIVQATDHGTWRRLLLVRFPYTFRKPHESLTGPDDRRGNPRGSAKSVTCRLTWGDG